MVAALSIAGQAYVSPDLGPERRVVAEQAGKGAEFGRTEQAGLALELAGHAAYDVGAC
jgi:hypothetical protein